MADERGRASELLIRIGLLVVTGLLIATVFGDDLRVLVGRGAQPPAAQPAQPR
jgi:hypothetical protein